MHYFVRSEFQVYNDLSDLRQLPAIRERRQDRSTILEAFRWEDGLGWVRMSSQVVSG